MDTGVCCVQGWRMDLTRSRTVNVLTVLGALIGAAAFFTVGPEAGAGAVGVVVLVAVAGFWFERREGIDKLLVLVEPVAVSQVDPTRCGVDKTAPRLLEKSKAREGKHLLAFVSRAEARTVGRTVKAAVDAHESVVVGLIGEPKAGKSRCMFETVRRRVPDALFFSPKPSPDAVRQVLADPRFGSSKRWSVLWLDDLQEFIATGSVDEELLEGLLEVRRVIVAVTARERLAITLLEDAPELSRLVPGDGHDGQQLIKTLGPQVAEVVGGEGLGAACVGGPQLLDMHRSGRHPDDTAAVPEGQIVVECLIAAEDLGVLGLTREQLRDVYGHTHTVHATDENFDRGLRWALRPLYAEIALVTGHGDSYRAYSYVVEHAMPIGDYRQRADHALAATIPLDDLLELAARAHEATLLQRAALLYELAIDRTDDRARQAAIIGTLGIVQFQLGRFEDALATLGRAVAIEERVYGPDHHEVASTLGNLGSVQLTLGRFEDALATLGRALAIEEHVYGPDHHEVASTLGNLGSVQRELGRFEDALATQGRALAIKERVYGPDHYEVATPLTNLGNVQIQLGRFEDALATLGRALAIEEHVYGPDHHEVASTLTNLGIVQLELGRFEDALATQGRALAIKERVYGPDHHEVASTLGNIGSVQLTLGRFEDALATLGRTLAIEEHVYGPDHHEVASTLTNLGIAQLELGCSEDALATLGRALAIEEHVYGPDHHEVASTLTNLGIAQLELERPADAERSVRRALTIFETQLPADHPSTKFARRLLQQLVAARDEVLLNMRDDDDAVTPGSDPVGL